MAESRTGPKFGHPTLFLFLVYFSFTSPFLLDLHDAFTTCSMTNTTHSGSASQFRANLFVELFLLVKTYSRRLN